MPPNPSPLCEIRIFLQLSRGAPIQQIKPEKQLFVLFCFGCFIHFILLLLFYFFLQTDTKLDSKERWWKQKVIKSFSLHPEYEKLNSRTLCSGSPVGQSKAGWWKWMKRSQVSSGLFHRPLPPSSGTIQYQQLVTPEKWQAVQVINIYKGKNRIQTISCIYLLLCDKLL